MLVLGAHEVASALDGRETEVIEAVSRAYVNHRRGRCSVPHSVFLRFAEDDPNRAIGLPAYLADEEPIAGLKWITSFPGNTARGLDRASAVLVLNSTSTGRPIAVMEASIISARRTAASAALAARTLHAKGETRVGLIGCGLINFEVLRFVRICFPMLEHVALFDIDPAAAQRFARRSSRELPGLTCRTSASAEQVFADAPLVSVATVAGAPHIASLAGLSARSTVLHLSLRDFAPAAIRAVDNVVDDTDHVLRARTSLHLTELEDGNRAFVRCPLADVLTGDAPARVEGRPTVFSPFGLGILDIAVARLVLEHARSVGEGIEIHGFLPESWVERATGA
ncbi:2,3-diaminopropionate biosynthesis protein SbnB [Sorangium sp. So ce385]|uniref:2,3-diaminopropionate biosynthesis protein SbnB n=1 Tax=Sorangium sp. So ce385 TaxID=3133308 RepID=UPI003F5C6031